MNRLVFYCWRIEEEICKKMQAFRIKRTKYGLKTINTALVRQMPKVISEEPVLLSPSDLFLGIDYLNDDYTLLDTSIEESPHIQFIRAILNDEDLSKTDYIKRCEKGSLDGRRGKLCVKNFSLFKNRCQSRIKQLDDMQPVLVYQVNNRYYIYDGKHRAALCALKGVKVKCILVDYRFSDNALYKVMNKENNFNKHLNLLS